MPKVQKFAKRFLNLGYDASYYLAPLTSDPMTLSHVEVVKQKLVTDCDLIVEVAEPAKIQAHFRTAEEVAPWARIIIVGPSEARHHAICIRDQHTSRHTTISCDGDLRLKLNKLDYLWSKESSGEKPLTVSSPVEPKLAPVLEVPLGDWENEGGMVQ